MLIKFAFTRFFMIPLLKIQHLQFLSCIKINRGRMVTVEMCDKFSSAQTKRRTMRLIPHQADAGGK